MSDRKDVFDYYQFKIKGKPSKNVDRTRLVEQKNWNLFFLILRFKRWFGFFQYLFLFIFFAICVFYFSNKQVQYVRKEWTLYDLNSYHSSLTLDSGKIYYVYWDNTSQDINMMKVNNTLNFFSNIRAHWPVLWDRYQTITRGNFWGSIYLNGGFYTKVNKPTELSIDLMDYKEDLSKFTRNYKKIYVSQTDTMDISKFIYLDSMSTLISN